MSNKFNPGDVVVTTRGIRYRIVGYQDLPDVYEVDRLVCGERPVRLYWSAEGLEAVARLERKSS